MIDENIKTMYLGYFAAFDAVKAKDPELQRKIDDWKRRVETFAASLSNILDFYPKYMETGLSEEYTQLVSQLYMQDNDTGKQADTPTSENAVISVRNFLEQYRTAYDEVRKAGYRKRAEKVYEDIFAIADRTDNMIEAQIMLERERLLWKIVSEDWPDIYGPILEAADPLFKPVYLALKYSYENYLGCESDEEMSYRGQRAQRQLNIIPQFETIRITFAASILVISVNAIEARSAFWYWYMKDEMGKARANATVALVARDKCRHIIQLLKETFGLTFDDLVADKHLRSIMLTATPLVTLGRYRKALPPAQLDFYSEIINEQILPDLSDDEFLQHKTRSVRYKFYEAADYDEKIRRIANENSMKLTYYKYQDELDKKSSVKN